MKIAVLDFEQVARCYKPYVDGIMVLETRSEELREELGGLQGEAQKIMAAAAPTEGEDLDEATMAAKQEAVQEQIQRLQQEAMLKDRTFKQEADDEQRRLVTEAYQGITKVVEAHVGGEDASFDMVLNRSEVVFFKPEHDVTETVIGLLKEQSLYTEDRLKEANQEG